MQSRPRDVTMEWTVTKRSGKVFNLGPIETDSFLNNGRVAYGEYVACSLPVYREVVEGIGSFLKPAIFAGEKPLYREYIERLRAKVER